MEKLTQQMFDTAYISSKHIRWPDDCIGFQKAARELGVELTLIQCQEVWEMYSECEWAASWMQGCNEPHFVERALKWFIAAHPAAANTDGS